MRGEKMRMRGLTRISKRVSEMPCKQPGQLKHKQWVDVGDDITTGVEIRGRIFKHWHLDRTSYPLAIHHGDFTFASTVQRHTRRSFWTQMRMCKHRVEAMRRVQRKRARGRKRHHTSEMTVLGSCLMKTNTHITKRINYSGILTRSVRASQTN